jgi:Tfp pilus assembly PilM family ATPase
VSRYLAIDLDAAGYFVCSGTAQKGAVKLESAVAIVDELQPLTLQSAPALGLKLKVALGKAGMMAAPVLVSVPRDRLIFKDIKHPKSSPAEEPAVVRFQSQRDLAVPADTLVMDYVPVPNPAGLDEQKATVAFIRKDYLEAVKTMIESAGLKLQLVHPRPFAASAAIQQGTRSGTLPAPEAGNKVALALLSLWPGGGEFVVSRGEQTLFSRNLSAGALTSEATLIGEAKRSLAAFKASFPQEELGGVYLAETEENAASWAARLEQALQVPMQAYDPLSSLKPSKSAPELSSRFVGPVGLLASRALYPVTPLNFITPRQPKAETKGSTKVLAYSLLFLMLVVGGGVLALYLFDLELNKRRAIAAQSKTDVEKKITTEQFDVNRLVSITDFRSRSVNWLDTFYDITEAAGSVDKLRTKEFEGVTAPSNAVVSNQTQNKGNVAALTPYKSTLTMKVISVDDQQPQDILSLFYNEKQFYFSPNSTSTNLTSGAKGNSEAKDTTITVDVTPRKADQYSRVLKAEFPKQPPPPVEEKKPVVIDEEDLP